ncbi:Secreted beta-glucosidase sun1 [Penicillium macrosclerotiorum]|uniref:Secreted beta-glucosidase sun1 n=1 Tax=Penicillium macrosclerotiorum TaxID=303699 RepID=UPI0025467DC9|nr:Secreted beta-glucosidase sun1 [Penicillium macrosclerotiorum]KAJ5698371.1 Secreted beta-glucosidase sun1 [Penicillium macrosclerotiorum]
MKFTNSVAVTLATAGSLVAAHGHGHAHFHKRAVDTETDTAVVAGPTVYDFVVYDPSKSGTPEAISAEEACEGLAEHEYEWLDDPIANACPTSTPVTSSTPTPTPTSTVAAQVLLETSAAITPATSPTSSAEPTTTSTSSVAATSSAVASSSASSSSTSTGIDADFPDGEIDCGTFPSDYGAVALDYLGLGGYSGIQYLTWVDEIVSDITTAVTGDSCSSGAMCSYACPAGYQKSQWPSTQGSTGQSIGGLKCKNGKLYLTNSSLSKKLCIQGTGGVYIRNKLSKDVAVCRTDYPGTESETIPLAASAGLEHELTCPDGATYYKWEGKTTSAQYYVNNAGVSTEDGCQWANSSTTMGNWAPMNFGVGYSSGATWLSMFKNEPTTTADLDFKVKLVGDDLSDSCSYDGEGNFYNSDGKITSGNGCTVSFSSGSAYFVFYD